ncbi:MAG: hypothetical protein SPE59_00595 [Treponema sp.]|nr:hypothetical protein [Treponema sp.]
MEIWNPEDTSLFIKKHKHDYMEVAKKYEISETNARNIFCKAPCKYNFAADAKNGKRCESRRVLHSS